MICEHCGGPITAPDDALMLSFADDLYAHTDCDEAR